MRRLRAMGQQLMADRAKFSVMVALVGVALLLWGRVLTERVPRTATASPSEIVVVNQPAATALEEEISDVTELVYADVRQTLARDLFAIDRQRFAQKPKLETDSITQAKSPSYRTDVEDTARLAAALRLQSTVLGDEPRAMINGSLVGPGQKVMGFVVKEIMHRQVVVERDGKLFLLKM